MQMQNADWNLKSNMSKEEENWLGGGGGGGGREGVGGRIYYCFFCFFFCSCFTILTLSRNEFIHFVNVFFCTLSLSPCSSFIRLFAISLCSSAPSSEALHGFVLSDQAVLTVSVLTIDADTIPAFFLL